MNYRKRAAFGAVLSITCIFLAAGCASSDKEGSTENAKSSSGTVDTSEMFTNRDLDFTYDEGSAVKIQLSDEGSSCDSKGVSISDSVITISEEGTYILSGSLTEGRIVVDAGDTDKLQLVLDNAEVNCSTSAALYVKQADKVFVTLAEGSDNYLSNQEDFIAIDENNIDAVIFAKDDLTLNGTGSLSITAAYGHGIVSKDDLVLTGGNYQITAADHALSGKDSVRIAEGNFLLSSGKDGIQADYNEDTEEASSDRERGFIYIAGGEFQIAAGDDGMQASSFAQIADGKIQIEASDDGIHADSEASVHNGEINITKCYEGIEGQKVEITGGSIYITADDDGLNSAGGNDQSSFAGGQREDPFAVDEDCEIHITGGSITINASGDGIDSNGNLYVSGGEIYVSGPENDGNGALDYAGEAQITGGTAVAVGGSGMAQNFGGSSTQGAMLVNLSEWVEGTLILTDSSGTEVISYTPEKRYNSIVISTSEIQQGETYTLTAGGQESIIEMTELIYGTGGMGGRMGAPGQGGRQEGTEPPADMGERPEGGMEPPSDMEEMPEGGMEPPADMRDKPEGGMEPPMDAGREPMGNNNSPARGGNSNIQ